MYATSMSIMILTFGIAIEKYGFEPVLCKTYSSIV